MVAMWLRARPGLDRRARRARRGGGAATRRTLLRITAVAVAALGVLTIGVSRLYLGVHWLTDVVTGWFLGGAWLAVCVTTLCVLNRRRSGQARPEQAAVGGAQPAA